MALIKCPECSRDVSDKADACIHCGYPLKKYTKCLINGTEYDLSFILKEEDKVKSMGKLIKMTNCGISDALDVVNKIRESKEIPPSISLKERSVPKCPHCSSTEISPIDAVERIWSVQWLGLASDKVGKSFKCHNCGYTW